MPKLNDSPLIRSVIALSLLVPAQALANIQKDSSKKINDTTQKIENTGKRHKIKDDIWGLFDSNVFKENNKEDQSREKLLLTIKKIESTINYIIENHEEILKKYNIKNKEILSRFSILKTKIATFLNENKKTKFSKEDLEFFKSTIELDLIILKGDIEYEDDLNYTSQSPTKRNTETSSTSNKIKYPNVIQQEELRRIRMNIWYFIKEYVC